MTKAVSGFNRLPALNRRKTITIAALLAAAAIAGPASAESCTASPAPEEAGTIWWNELVTANPDQTRGFYEKVIGWTSKIVSSEDTSRPPRDGEQEYTVFIQDGQEAAGLLKIEGEDTSGLQRGWLTYIQVANVDDAVVAALQNGGKLLKAPFNTPTIGRLAIIADPQGVAVGLVTPISQSTTR